MAPNLGAKVIPNMKIRFINGVIVIHPIIYFCNPGAGPCETVNLGKFLKPLGKDVFRDMIESIVPTPIYLGDGVIFAVGPDELERVIGTYMAYFTNKLPYVIEDIFKNGIETKSGIKIHLKGCGSERTQYLLCYSDSPYQDYPRIGRMEEIPIECDINRIIGIKEPTKDYIATNSIAITSRTIAGRYRVHINWIEGTIKIPFCELPKAVTDIPEMVDNMTRARELAIEYNLLPHDSFPVFFPLNIRNKKIEIRFYGFPWMDPKGEDKSFGISTSPETPGIVEPIKGAPSMFRFTIKEDEDLAFMHFMRIGLIVANSLAEKSRRFFQSIKIEEIDDENILIEMRIPFIFGNKVRMQPIRVNIGYDTDTRWKMTITDQYKRRFGEARINEIFKKITGSGLSLPYLTIVEDHSDAAKAFKVEIKEDESRGYEVYFEPAKRAFLRTKIKSFQRLKNISDLDGRILLDIITEVYNKFLKLSFL